MKTWPALDVRFPDEAGPVADPDGYFVAFLDDYMPTAIVDTSTASGPAWRVFFGSGDARAAASSAIAAAWTTLAVEPVDVPDEQWAERSQASLRAIRIGRIVVTPPWDLDDARRLEPERPDDDGEPSPSVVVVIEPSMGFGTGHHESTRLCLRALQRLDLRGRRVLDLGTGSGVLAIAAALLGCARALAIDDDPDAVTAAEQNLILNDIRERVEIRQTDLISASPLQAEVVLGNLTGALLRRHAAEVLACLAPGGTMILSGFTEDERLAVTHAFQPLVVVREDTENGWLALTLGAWAHGPTARLKAAPYVRQA